MAKPKPYNPYRVIGEALRETERSERRRESRSDRDGRIADRAYGRGRRDERRTVREPPDD